MNGIYIRALGPQEFSARCLPYVERELPATVKRPIDAGYLEKIAPLVQERAKTLSEVPSLVDFFFSDVLEYDSALLPGKLEQVQAIEVLKKTIQALDAVGTWAATDLEAAVRPLVEEMGLKAGPFFGVLRVAVTGRTASPPLFETIEVLGKERCRARLKAALDRL
jgi:glutamyl-tRNA synthetase